MPSWKQRQDAARARMSRSNEVNAVRRRYYDAMAAGHSPQDAAAIAQGRPPERKTAEPKAEAPAAPQRAPEPPQAEQEAASVRTVGETEERTASTAPSADHGDCLHVAHRGFGRWAVMHGDEVITFPFDSKEDAEKALEREQELAGER